MCAHVLCSGHRLLIAPMMLPEAAIIRHVQCMVDTMMAEQNRQGRTVSRDAIEVTIARALSRMSSQEEASYLTEHGLKLFSTKGMEYHECTDRFVIVTYEEQDGEGFFSHVDYLGRVKAVDPFDGICVQFGEDGDWWVGDDDEWMWMDRDLQALIQLL